MAELPRTYVCPICGYDGVRMGNVASPLDVNFTMGCPRCQTVDGVTVWLVETSDPRDG